VPLPLAAIAIRRDWRRAGPAVDQALRRERRYALATPDAEPQLRDGGTRQAMDPDVMARHIQLYVNDYTLALDERAVHADGCRGGDEGCSARPAVAADFV